LTPSPTKGKQRTPMNAEAMTAADGDDERELPGALRARAS
jgi:hypothetical protein